MVFATRDLFDARRPPPPDTEPPPPGSPLFRYLVKRLFDSFNLPRGPLRYFQWMNLSERAVQERTFMREWPKVRAQLDRDTLVPLGLVKVHSLNPLAMGENHQVLAYGYDLDEGAGALRVWVYDPNYPGEDDISLALNVVAPPSVPLTYSTGSRVRGFFYTRYRGIPCLARIESERAQS
jgi:hypothetical protein